MKLAVLQACLRSVCGEHVGVWVVAQDDMEELPYPTVKDYLVWVRNRMTVTFRRLDQPKVTLIHPCHHPDLMLGAVDAPPNLALTLLHSCILWPRCIFPLGCACPEGPGDAAHCSPISFLCKLPSLEYILMASAGELLQKMFSICCRMCRRRAWCWS